MRFLHSACQRYHLIYMLHFIFISNISGAEQPFALIVDAFCVHVCVSLLFASMFMFVFHELLLAHKESQCTKKPATLVATEGAQVHKDNQPSDTARWTSYRIDFIRNINKSALNNGWNQQQQQQITIALQTNRNISANRMKAIWHWSRCNHEDYLPPSMKAHTLWRSSQLLCLGPRLQLKYGRGYIMRPPPAPFQSLNDPCYKRTQVFITNDTIHFAECHLTCLHVVRELTG